MNAATKIESQSESLDALRKRRLSRRERIATFAERKATLGAWRITIILLGMAILCSCHSPSAHDPFNQNSVNAPPPAPPQSAVVPAAYVEPQTASGAPCPPCPANVPYIMSVPGMEAGVPVPYTAAGPWIPPGIVPPWPADEYLRDGGEVPPGVEVGRNNEVLGLKMEDTVARFSTLDGRTLVVPSNQVDLYAPRFNAVRQVVEVDVNEQRKKAAGVLEPVKPVIPRTSEPVVTSAQPLQPVRGIGSNPANQLRGRATWSILLTDLTPRTFDNIFRVYENTAIIRTGTYHSSDAPILARGSQAAVNWQSNEGVRIILDEKAAASATAAQRAQEIFTIGTEPNPRLRIVKVASAAAAEPGDEISFTIRFDNVGNQPIGSVQLIDSLTTRLEYVPDSAQCSLAARFSTQPNEGGSLVVRCVLNEPLPPGKGGVFRFRCLVR